MKKILIGVLFGIILATGTVSFAAKVKFIQIPEYISGYKTLDLLQYVATQKKLADTKPNIVSLPVEIPKVINPKDVKTWDLHTKATLVPSGCIYNITCLKYELEGSVTRNDWSSYFLTGCNIKFDIPSNGKSFVYPMKIGADNYHWEAYIDDLNDKIVSVQCQSYYLDEANKVITQTSPWLKI